MNSKELKRKEILLKIKSSEIGIEEGIQLIKNLGKDEGSRNAAYKETDIAIIGISGRFPGARNVEEFWDNLKNGVDSVSEIPKKRWDVNQYYSEDRKQPGKTYCKWGGVMEDYDKFDPLFFNISPKEAQIMDPQQRVILEEAWKAVEDAGYMPSSLSDMDCGVFVGATQGDYNKRAAKAGRQLSAQLMTGTQISMLAARISYYLNLNGPNITVDTACSSSLAAVHLACQSLRNNESKIALAGGVNVLTTPEIYIMTSKGGMLSEDGKCKAFDNSANGFIPSEGAGVLVLKKARQAVVDKDHIYGIIKGSKVNQDGKTNGITAPSSQAQFNLETSVYQDYQLNPETITYVEAHGTGTKLGDPIEVSALTKAFRQYTGKKQYCAIGSVKSNIGHALVASGVLSIIKVLLCMKNKTLVPSLHYEKCNEHIDFENSPFYVNTDTTAWNMENDMPRRAAVSSFGLSGTNCHVVLEEGPDEEHSEQLQVPLHLITFSAKTRNSLLLMYQEMQKYLKKNEVNLGDMAYTLNTGRDKQDIRSCFLVQSVKEWKEKLDRVIQGEMVSGYQELDLKKENCLRNLEQEYEVESLFSYIKKLDEKAFTQKVKDIADHFVSGYQISFQTLYGDTNFKRGSYPVYQFDEDTYWIDTDFSEQGKYDAIHPMLDKNVSDFNTVQFVKTFTGNEFYNVDHVFEGKKLVPGAAQLEMACAAVKNLTGQSTFVFSNVSWLNPILVLEDTTVRIRLKKSADLIDYTIETEAGSLYSNGSIQSLREAGSGSILDIEKLIKNRNIKEKQDIYQDFLKFNMKYGPDFQVIEKIYTDPEYCVGKLRISDAQKAGLSEFILHPALMDGIFQTVTIFKTAMGVSLEEAYLPYGIGNFKVYSALEENLYVYARPAAQAEDDRTTQCFDIQISNASGEVIGEITNYKVKKVHNGRKNALTEETDRKMLYFNQVWRPEALEPEVSKLSGNTLAVSENKNTGEVFKNYVDGTLITLTHGSKANQISAQSYEADWKQKESVEELVGMLKKQNIKIDQVVILIENAENLTIKNYEAEIEKSACSVLYLCQAFLAYGIDARFLYVTQNNEFLTNPAICAVQGLAKTMVIENPSYKFQVLHLDDKAEKAAELIVRELGSKSDAFEIRYENGTRYVKTVNEQKDIAQNGTKNLLKNGGTYLITGGAGGLGMIFANYLAEKYNANVVLAGRSPLSEQVKQKISRIVKNRSCNMEYKQADVTKLEEVEKLVLSTKKQFGSIDGVIHSAGVIKDSFVRYKTMEEFKQVASVKIGGLMNLDEALQDENLDFLLVCSSFGGVAGNVGQCDYAYANSFMDYFMAWRNRNAKGRYGRCLAINWPLWAEGRMNVDVNSKKKLEKKFGMLPLSTENGIRAVEELLAAEDTNVIVMEGRASDLRSKLPEISYQKSDWSDKQSKNENQSGEDFYQRAKEYIRTILADAIMLEPEKIYDDEPFETYGIDSVMIVSINDMFEEKFGNISKTLLFEYKDLKSLTDYFVEHMSDKLMDKLNVKRQEPKPEEDTRITKLQVKENVDSTAEDDIAIIGIAGKYPEADDLDAFWENLKAGKDCIREIPEERWDYHHHFDEDRTKSGSFYCKWGGFISEADKFDALYFNVAPKEAEMTDPQERLFLETSWKALQDAGYSYESMPERKVGVFVGAMHGHYELYGVEETMKGNVMALNSSFASIANRVSYFFNFTGPSIALDTMCSSSITALHLACQSIRNKECNAAIVGASNLSLHENKYLLLSQGNFLASDGRCRSFGEGGDGYVPGEGVGAIVVKPLKKAKEDGDHIYAVVKASSLNHGGRTNGYTVPNPVEQGNLIQDAVAKAGIPAESLSYVEAHGTGTKLGDPIELTGMSRGLQLGQDGKCAIGSVKSNIGHLEAAAGIAAITKVVLMMKHKKYVPSIHSEVLNKNLNIEDTPFYVQRKYEDWKRKIYYKDGEQKEYPRRAGISSFGAGGANGHVILEEYIEDREEKTKQNSENLFVFSARSESLLKKYLDKFVKYLDSIVEDLPKSAQIPSKNRKEEVRKLLSNVLDMKEEQICLDDNASELGMDLLMVNQLIKAMNETYNLNLTANDILGTASMSELIRLADSKVSEDKTNGSLLERIAYTLQSGRDAMKFKVAVRADTIPKLKEGILAFLGDRELPENVYQGSKKTARQDNKNLERALEQRDLDALAKFFTEGYAVNWSKLYQKDVIEKTTLPIPDLDSRRYWFDGFNRKSKRSSIEVPEKKREEVKQQVLSGEFDAKLEEQMLYAYHTYHGTNVKLEFLGEQIAMVRMQDDKDKNMYSNELIEGLMSAFYKINQNEKVKAVILTGYDHVFCMGGMQDQLLGIADRELSFTDAPFLYKGLLKTAVPVISAMQGHASGGGMLLGLYADIVIMAREAVYTASFTKYGFTPGMGATFILPEKLGQNIATEMMFTARSIRGEELEKRGASVIFKHQEDVLDEAVRIAKMIIEKPRLTLSVLKKNLADKILPGLEQTIGLEDKMHEVTFTNPEVKQRIRYFYSHGEQPKEVEEAKTQPEDKEEFMKKVLTYLEQGEITPEQASAIMKM